jgi:signal transduction histidine kinase
MEFVHRLVRAYRAADPARVDAATAVVVAVLIVAELASGSYLDRPVAGLVGATLFAAPLAFRRRAPFAALAAAMGALILSASLDAQVDQAFTAFIAVVLLMWTVAASEERLRRVVVAGGFVVAGLLSIMLVEGSITAGDVAWTVVMLVVLPTVGARLLRSNERLAAALAERARGLETERDERARLAAAQERERIAAELHDVVAHGVSAMVVQAGAARRVIAAGGDPDDGRRAIAEVEASGRAALDELRRLLGVLRRGDEALALAPQPTLARVDRLVARLRDEGLPVELAVEGRPGALPVGLDVTAYRIVEEALAEVLRVDGSVPTRVSVRYRPRELELEVADEGGPRDRSAEPEDGLALRERVELFGGSLHAGRRRGGGWVMHARLPIEAA